MYKIKKSILLLVIKKVELLKQIYDELLIFLSNYAVSDSITGEKNIKSNPVDLFKNIDHIVEQSGLSIHWHNWPIGIEL